jgi:acyl dehydratase
MGLYFEQFEVGQQFETASRRVTREMILEFAELTGDRNPLHTDVDFMRASAAGDVLAHGLLIQSLSVGLIADLGIMTGTTIALLEASCRFVKPVIPGDEVRAVVSIESKRETRKPDRGVLIRKVEVLNQLDEVVVESTLISLMRLNREGEPE